MNSTNLRIRLYFKIILFIPIFTNCQCMDKEQIVVQIIDQSNKGILRCVYMSY